MLPTVQLESVYEGQTLYLEEYERLAEYAIIPRAFSLHMALLLVRCFSKHPAKGNAGVRPFSPHRNFFEL